MNTQKIVASHHEVTRHWIRQLYSQEDPGHHCGEARPQAPEPVPISGATPGRIPTSDHNIRAARKFFQHLRQHARVVLQVCIHAGHYIPCRGRKSLHNRPSEPVVPGSAKDTHLWVARRNLLCHLPGQVGRIVIGNNNFIQHVGQCILNLFDQGANVLAFVEGWGYYAELHTPLRGQ